METNIVSIGDKEIRIELEKYHIIQEHRTTKKLGGKSIQTLAVKFVFSCKQIPEFVILSYSRHHLKPYVASVIQCFRCRRFWTFFFLLSRQLKMCEMGA